MATKKPTTDDRLPWERQVGEKDEPWEAFQIYFKQEKRNAQTVADGLHKSYTLIRRWKKRWNWEERCRAYDNALLREEFEEIKKGQKRTARNKMAFAAKLQNLGLTAISNVDASKLTEKDLPLIMKMFQMGFQYEDLGRESLMSLYEKELYDGMVQTQIGGKIPVDRSNGFNTLPENNLLQAILSATGEDIESNIPELERKSDQRDDEAE